MTINPLFKQYELADVVGTTPSMISYILRHERSPSVPMAEALEEATGVCREAWLFPERHFNPYFKDTGGNPLDCMRCRNRESMSHKRVDLLEKRVGGGEDWGPDPTHNFAKYWMAHQGNLTGLQMGLFVHTPEGLLTKKWRAGKRVAGETEIITEEHTPDLLQEIGAGRPYFKSDVSKSSMSRADKATVDRVGIKSVVVTPRKDFSVYLFSSTAIPLGQNSVDVQNRIAQIIEYCLENPVI
jgi:transcriptional regulator with XRE-family HTH domain